MVVTTRSQTSDKEQKDIAKPLSAKAELNNTIIERLQTALQDDPEVNLYSIFPGIVKRAVYEKKQASVTPELDKPNAKSRHLGPADFCADLVAAARTAEIVYPLSDETVNFLSQFLQPGSKPADLRNSLVHVLSQMILNCERLWEFPTRGVVLKSNSNLVAKIISGNNDYTEYTAIRYLAEHAPDIQAPKPHGLVKFHTVRVMFMTYFPSITLQAAWPKLTQENKISIQMQLNDNFVKLRSLPDEGHNIGGIGGEGVKDHHRLTHRTEENLSTVTQFEDFQFSIPPHGDSLWVKFLRRLLPPAPSKLVFTHDDVREENIMVDVTESGEYVVTGIIDWETSGFYPDYFESTRMLYVSTPMKNSDWLMYLPTCIDPTRYPERWLVSRLWDQCVTSW